MKRFRLAVLLAVASLTTAPVAHAGATLALKGGLTYSQVTTELFDPSFHTGYAAGVGASFDLTPHVALAPEVLYVRKGAKLAAATVSPLGIPLTFREDLDLDYLEVPVLLRFTLPGAGPIRLRALAGPSFGLKVKESLRTSGIVSLATDSDLLKSSDVGIALGAGAVLADGPAHWTLEGRYTFGVTNISDFAVGGDVKNGVFMALLGVEFPIASK